MPTLCRMFRKLLHQTNHRRKHKFSRVPELSRLGVEPFVNPVNPGVARLGIDRRRANVRDAALNNRVATLTNRVATLTDRNATMEADNIRLHAENATLTNRVATLKTELANLASQFTAELNAALEELARR